MYYILITINALDDDVLQRRWLLETVARKPHRERDVRFEGLLVPLAPSSTSR